MPIITAVAWVPIHIIHYIIIILLLLYDDTSSLMKWNGSLTYTVEDCVKGKLITAAVQQLTYRNGNKACTDCRVDDRYTTYQLNPMGGGGDSIRTVTAG